MSVTGAPWLPRSIPDRSRLVELPGGRVFVVDVGPDPAANLEEPPLLLVHGLLTTHYVFDRLIPRLATGRRILAVDLPGAGDSDRPPPRHAEDYSPEDLSTRLFALLDFLEVQVVDLFGHDYGGNIAFVMATTTPDRVRRLMLCAPLLLHPRVPYEGPLAIAANLGAEVFRRTVRRADLQRVLAQAACSPELADESELHVFWDRLGRDGGREATHAMLTQLSGVVRMRERFAELRTPTLLVWGDRDRIVGPEQGARLAELLPGPPDLVLIEGSGHNPARERPEILARHIEDHCARGRSDLLGPSAVCHSAESTSSASSSER